MGLEAMGLEAMGLEAMGLEAMGLEAISQPGLRRSRRLARAPEAVAWRPRGRPLPLGVLSRPEP